MSARAKVLASMMLAAALASACEDHLPEVETDCHFTEECMPGLVCKLPDQACVPVPHDGVMGHFKCTVHASGVPAAKDSETDVSGFLGDIETNLLESVDCSLDTSGAQPFLEVTLLAQGYEGELRFRVLFRLPVAAAPADGLALHSVRSKSDILGAYLNEFIEVDPRSGVSAIDRNLAYARSGTVLLETPIDKAAPGLRVSGYVELELAASAATPAFGAACPNGPSDCGQDPRAVCVASAGTSTCTLACQPSDTCPAGTACTNGLCSAK